MRRERWVRGGHDETSAFDWHRAARELDVPLDQARGLYEEARKRATYPGSQSAENLYLDWLEAIAPQPARLAPGKRTLTMRAAAEMGGWPRLARLDEVPVDPGRRMRTSGMARMEQSFGQRFDDVEIHTDSPEVPAGEKAFTRGRHIYLESGVELDEELSERVLAHELAHVAQQERSPGISDIGAGGRRGAPSRGALEADAQQAALDALAGRAASVQLAAPAHAALGFSEGQPQTGQPRRQQARGPAPGGTPPAPGATPPPRTPAPGAPRAPTAGAPPTGAPPAGAPRTPTAPRQPAAPPPASAAPNRGPGTDGVLVPEAPGALSPQNASRVQTVGAQNQQVAGAVTTLPTADAQTDVARSAVVEPQAEQDARAQHGLVADVDTRPPPSPEIVAACDRIREVIRAKRPPDEDKLVEARPREMAQEAGQQMTAGVEERTGTVRDGYADMQQTPTGAPSRPPVPAITPPERVDTPPVNAAAAAPDQLRHDDVSLDGDVTAQQRRMEEAGMNTEAGRLVQDGPIGDARGGVGDLQNMAATDPQRVLQEQAAAVAHAQGDMRALQAQAERALAAARAGTVAQMGAHTTGVKTSEEDQRARAGQQMQAVFTRTQQAVDRLLQPLSGAAVARWDAGVATLSSTFESSLAHVKRRIEERHDGIGGAVLSLGDDVFGLPDWVVEDYDRAETAFSDGATSLLTDISRDVNAVIEDCKKLITEAREEIDRIVAALPADLQAWAQGEAARLGQQLDQLDQRVDQTQKGLNQDLIQRANSAVQQVREQVAALREAARGLIGKIADAIAAFIDNPGKAIVDGLLRLLGIPPASFWALVDQLGNVIDGIAAEPMRFANTLMSGVGKGFEQFFDRLPTHLGQALFQWLFSKLGEAGVSMPTDFSVRGIVTLVLEVLGISWPRVRAILARHIGEQNAELLDQAYQLISTLIERGPQGLFDMLMDQLDPGAIVDMIKEAALQFIMEAIVTRVAARIIMMLNPAGAILQAIEAIYRVIKWVMDNAARIFTLIESIVNGAAQILAGNISGVANLVESSLVRLIVPVIDFLAGYLGLGGIPGAIRDLIMGLQARVEQILDRVIGFVVGRARALWEAIRNRGRRPDEQPEAQPGQDGQPTDEVGVPSALVEPRPATLDHLTPTLKRAISAASSGTVIYQTGGDPQQVTQTLLRSHPDAQFDRESRRLTLPPISEGPLEAAQSLAELGQQVAHQTGVSKVTIVKGGGKWKLEGHINPKTTMGEGDDDGGGGGGDDELERARAAAEAGIGAARTAQREGSAWAVQELREVTDLIRAAPPEQRRPLQEHKQRVETYQRTVDGLVHQLEPLQTRYAAAVRDKDQVGDDADLRAIVLEEFQAILREANDIKGQTEPRPQRPSTEDEGAHTNRMSFQVQWNSNGGGPTFSEQRTATAATGVTAAQAESGLRDVWAKVVPAEAKAAATGARDEQIAWVHRQASAGGTNEHRSWSEYFTYGGYSDARVDIENRAGHNLRS